MIRNINITILLMLASFSASSVEIGLGSTFWGNSSISIPIRTEHYIFEPFISHWSYEYANEDQPSSESTSVSNYKSAIENNSIGLGIYAYQALAENFSINYGVKLGYIKTEEKTYNYYSYQSDSNGNISVSQDANNSDGSGYFVGPELGLEYKAYKNIYVGINAYMTYTNTKSTGTSEEYSYYNTLYSSVEEFDKQRTSSARSSTSTGSNLKVRLYF
ncbi:MAG: hypothetical protein H0W44_02805 [Gammaproteobacteria bacterium]|nr:hypothetical protein [Gammaproteobacteria bacterium]